VAKCSVSIVIQLHTAKSINVLVPLRLQWTVTCTLYGIGDHSCS